jgi:hypothetical protein
MTTTEEARTPGHPFGEPAYDLASEIATQVMNLPWTRHGLGTPGQGFDDDGLCDRHGDVQIIARRVIEATPAPSSPSVPDSVREALEAYDAADGFVEAYELRKSAQFRCEEWVRTLISTHPAGQSTGQRADLFEAGRRLIVEWGDAPELPEEMENALTRFEKVWLALDDGKPAPDSTRTGPVGTEEGRLIGPKMTPEQEQRIAHNLCGEFGPDAVMANAAFAKAFYDELYAAARPASPEAQGVEPSPTAEACRQAARRAAEQLSWSSRPAPPASSGQESA